MVYRQRSKEREVLGIAKIVMKEIKHFGGPFLAGTTITAQEAIKDGFTSTTDMVNWMLKAHGSRIRTEPLNKLTLEWL